MLYIPRLSTVPINICSLDLPNPGPCLTSDYKGDICIPVALKFKVLFPSSRFFKLAFSSIIPDNLIISRIIFTLAAEKAIKTFRSLRIVTFYLSLSTLLLRPIK